MYPDLEIASIDVFTDNLTGLTGTLIINVEGAIGQAPSVNSTAKKNVDDLKTTFNYFYLISPYLTKS